VIDQVYTAFQPDRAFIFFLNETSPASKTFTR